MKLIDCFISLHFDKIKMQIKNGVDWEARNDYFKRYGFQQKKLVWNLKNLKVEDKDVMRAILLFHYFAEHPKTDDEIKDEKKTKDQQKIKGENNSGSSPKSSIPQTCNALLNIACNKENKYIDFHKYKDLMRSSEQILKNIFNHFDINYIKRDPLHAYNNIRTIFSEILSLSKGEGCANCNNIIQVLQTLRNDESHKAFFQDPLKYWGELTYTLYDYITIIYFIERAVFITDSKQSGNESTSDSQDTMFNNYEFKTGRDGVFGEEKEKINIKIGYDTAGLILETSKSVTSFQGKLIKTNKKTKYNGSFGSRNITEQKDENNKHKTNVKLTLGGKDPQEIKEENNKCWHSFNVLRENTYQLCVYRDNKLKGEKEITIDKYYHDGCSVVISIPPENVKVQDVHIDDFILDINLEQCSENTKWIVRQLEIIDEKIEKEDGYSYKEVINKIKTVIGAVNTKEMRAALENIDTSHGLSASSTKEEIDEFLKRIETTVSNNFKEIISPLQEVQKVLSELKNNNDETSNLLKEILSKVNIGATKEEVACLIHEIKQAQKDLLSLEKKNKDAHDIFIDELKHIYEEVDGNKNIIEEIRKFNTDINKKLKELEKEVKKIKITLGIAALFIFIVASISILYFNVWNATTWIANHYNCEWACEWAYRAGDNDVAYNYAKKYEKEKIMSKATFWYNKAISRYEKLLADNPNQNDYIYRVAQMYMRGKGGSIDIEKAFEYMYKIRMTDKGIGLYTLLCIQMGDFNKAGISIKLNNKEWKFKKDDYMKLAECIMSLHNSDTLSGKTALNKNILQNTLSTLDSLSQIVNSIAREEILLSLAELNKYGYYANNRTKCNLYTSILLYTIAAREENSIPAQIYLEHFWEHDGCDLNRAFYFGDLAWKNGCVNIVPSLTRLAGYLKKSRSYLDSLSVDFHKADDFLKQNIEISLLRKNAQTSQDYSELEYSEKCVLSAFNPYKHWFDETYFTQIVRDRLKSNSNMDDWITDIAYNNYLKGIKYAKGYGVAMNLAKSDSLIKLAADSGCVDAIYTHARLLYNKGDKKGTISLLKQIANCDYRAVDWLAFIGYYGERETSYSLAYKYREWRWAHTSVFDEKVNMEDCLEQIDKLEYAIAINEFRNKELWSYLSGQLALLYTQINAPIDVIQFYLNIACNGNIKGDGYYCLLDITNFLLYEGMHKEAADAYERFCRIYFGREKQSISKNKDLAGFLLKHFPDRCEILKKDLGLDFTDVNIPDKNCIWSEYHIEPLLCPNDSIYKY